MTDLVERGGANDYNFTEERDQEDFEYFQTTFTDDELNYIRQVRDADSKLLNSTIFKNLPKDLQTDMEEKYGASMADKYAPPNKDKYVIARIRGEGQILVDEVDGTASAEAVAVGDIITLPYSSIREKVLADEAVLM